MSGAAPPVHLYEDLVRRFASAYRGYQLYAADHPLILRTLQGLIEILRTLHAQTPSIPMGVVDSEIVVANTPLPRASASMTDLLQRLQVHGIERIVIDRGVTVEELASFLGAVALGTAGTPATPEGGESPWSSPHIRIGRITRSDQPVGGIASDIAAIRQLYTDAVRAAEGAWEAALHEGMPDPGAASVMVDGLAEAVTQNRTALVALTAMKSYDNYTFTHMVNVSILTMAQARALGIEGRLLREFGLSALMHDIGKVRTPVEILNKPGKLTEQEFAVMRRHTIDGAEILRRTPEVPILAPVVAFEHHLRLDGSGYPPQARRSSLNLGTMLCSIADLYDAMRSQRAYQQAFPTDRILAVLKRPGRHEFDPHLVRRFVQLLGIYPPGNLVRLIGGEVAVVLQTHAPDPYRPKVAVVIDARGERLQAPVERNLWAGEGGASSIAAPVDPAEVDLDPLALVPVNTQA